MNTSFNPYLEYPGAEDTELFLDINAHGDLALGRDRSLDFDTLDTFDTFEEEHWYLES